MDSDTVRAFSAVAAIGLAVGGTDIVSRYRDSPLRALNTWPALAYLLINAGAACFALYLARAFDWTFGATGDQAVWLRQVLVAGFGAMALFRTSLFLTTVGEGKNDEIDFGPSSVLKAFLGAADRGVDRTRAMQSAGEAVRFMQGVDFRKAVEELPGQVSVLLQNASAEEREAFGREISALREQSAKMSDQASVLQLGLLCMRFAGPEVVQAAVASLGDAIRSAPPVGGNQNARDLLRLGPISIQHTA